MVIFVNWSTSGKGHPCPWREKDKAYPDRIKKIKGGEDGQDQYLVTSLLLGLPPPLRHISVNFGNLFLPHGDIFIVIAHALGSLIIFFSSFIFTTML